jgi:hypothetical protein
MFCPVWRQKYGFNFKQSYYGLRAVFFMEINMSFPGETRVIKLYSPVSFENGGLLEQVTLREPLVRDRIAFSKDRGSEEEKEARMIALLCNLSEQDIWQLTAADYAQLLDAFNVFMLPPEKRPKEG